MRNSIVTFSRTEVPKELKMFRKSVFVRTLAGSSSSWIFISVYPFTCIIGKGFWWKFSSVVIGILKDNLCLVKLGCMDLVQVQTRLSAFVMNVWLMYSWREKSSLLTVSISVSTARPSTREMWIELSELSTRLLQCQGVAAVPCRREKLSWGPGSGLPPAGRLWGREQDHRLRSELK